MKILVPAKRVPDPNSTIKVKPDGSGIVTDGLKWVINPFDEIALEEALRIKEKLSGSEVVLVGIGAKTSSEQLRTGLAMGADRAILVLTEEPLDSLAVARILQKLVTDEKADLVLMGKQAIDADSNQAGQMLADMLGWPQADLRIEGRARGGPEELAGHARGRRRSRSPVDAASRGGHRGSKTQRAPLRFAARHHEGP